MHGKCCLLNGWHVIIKHNRIIKKNGKSMKKKFIYLCAVICSMGLFTACSDDDDNEKIPGSQTTFTTEDGLLLTVNGETMVGKTATFTPANGSAKASITLSGEPLDLTALMSGAGKADNQPVMNAIMTCGVIPGSPEVTIPVDIEDGQFSGAFETEYCNFRYAGELTKSALQLTVSDLELKNKTLVGTVWTPKQPYSTPEGMMAGAPYINWISSATFTPGFPPNMLALMMCSSAFIPMPTPEDPEKTMDINTVLVTLLKDVTFESDGNITANYVDSKTFQPAVSPKNIIQYVLTGENSMLLYINPQLIIYDMMQGRAADMSPLLAQVMNLVPMLSKGVPAKYEIEGNSLTVYLDTETLLPLLKAAGPLFSDEDFVKSIIEQMPADMKEGFIGTMIEGIFKSIPSVAEGTTVFEIGLNLDKVQ